MAKNATKKLESEWPHGFSKPAERALAAIGVTRLTELTKYSEKALLARHGMGPKRVRVLRSALKEKGSKLLVTLIRDEEHGKTHMTLKHEGLPAGPMQEMTRLGWNTLFDKMAKALA